jgi:hypothetical protein
MTASRLAWASTVPAALLEDTSSPKVTIVTPIDHGDSRVDAIRFRSIVDRMAEIAATAPGRPDVEPLAERVLSLIADLHPLDHAHASVAVFASPAAGHLVPIHGTFGERLRMGSEYDLLPLVDEYDPVGCHLLTLTRAGARLWRAARWSIDPIEVPGMPESLAEMTEYRDLETQLQLHRTGTSGQAMFHGQGIDEKADVEPTKSYLRAVDRAVATVLGPSEPLIVIGPDSLPAVFRSVSAHAEFGEQVSTHPDGITEDELTRIGTGATGRLAAARTRRLLDTADDLAGSGRTVTDSDMALRRAREGRIDQVLVDPHRSDDAVVETVAETLRHGGQAFPIIDADRPLVAILRY